MAELKAKENTASVKEFLNSVEDDIKRKDCFAIAEMMKKETNAEAKMWGASIVVLGTITINMQVATKEMILIQQFLSRLLRDP